MVGLEKKKNIYKYIIIKNHTYLSNFEIKKSFKNSFFFKTNFKCNIVKIEKRSFNLNDFKFNNVMVSYDDNLKTFFSKNFHGINNYFINIIEKRVEFNLFNNYNQYKFDK